MLDSLQTGRQLGPGELEVQSESMCPLQKAKLSTMVTMWMHDCNTAVCPCSLRFLQLKFCVDSTKTSFWWDYKPRYVYIHLQKDHNTC